jgi:hypothetical protein
MKDVILNEKRKNEVEKIHSKIKSTYEGLSLETILVLGYNWSESKINDIAFSETYEDLRKFFYVWDYNKSEGTLKDFGLYDQPALHRHAKFRAMI